MFSLLRSHSSKPNSTVQSWLLIVLPRGIEMSCVTLIVSSVGLRLLHGLALLMSLCRLGKHHLKVVFVAACKIDDADEIKSLVKTTADADKGVASVRFRLLWIEYVFPVAPRLVSVVYYELENDASTCRFVKRDVL